MSKVSLDISIDRPVKFESITMGQYFTKLNGRELFHRLDREGMSSDVETGKIFQFDYREEFLVIKNVGIYAKQEKDKY